MEGWTHGQRVHVDYHEVQGHGQSHGSHQPQVAPGGHPNQGLILRQAVGWANEEVNMQSCVWQSEAFVHVTLKACLYFWVCIQDKGYEMC